MTLSKQFNEIVSVLNNYISVFDTPIIKKEQIIRANFQHVFAKEITDAQEKLAQAIKNKQDNIDELSHYYNNLEQGYEKKCENAFNRINNAITLYNIEQREFLNLAIPFQLILCEKTHVLYVVRQDTTVNECAFYIAVLKGFVDFVQLNF